MTNRSWKNKQIQLTQILENYISQILAMCLDDCYSGPAF